MRMANRAIATILCIATASVVWAKEPENAHVWDPHVRSVAVFKNGMGFFIREGAVTLRDGWCVSGPVPPALFGTLAIYAADDSRMVDVVGAGPGEIVDFGAQRGPEGTAEKLGQLRKYLGLNVALTSEHDETPQADTGRLIEVTEQFAVLNVDRRLAAVRTAELKKLQVLDYPLRAHVEGPDADGAPITLGMAYLRQGVTWIPEYSLRVVDESTAELTLRATLVNEVEDLVNADVHFVVGVPSFVHAQYLSPIAVGQVIRTVAAALPAGFASQIASNAIMNRAALATDRRPASPSPETRPVVEEAHNLDQFMAGLPQMDSAGATDFTVYTQKGMTVRKGEKALVTVFRRKISYAHFYRWESPGELKHYLVLQNDTDTAWTTGPAIAVSAARPLCEDTLKYTPRGSGCELPVTTAVNIATSADESEADRKLKAYEPSRNVFLDLVTIAGQLRVHNFEQRSVKLHITRTVPGRLTSALDDGRMVQDTSKLKLAELSGSVSWTLTLEPGEQRELTYRYERYVPSN